jgi:hypothetical protein
MLRKLRRLAVTPVIIMVEVAFLSRELLPQRLERGGIGFAERRRKEGRRVMRGKEESEYELVLGIAECTKLLLIVYRVSRGGYKGGI